MEETPLPPDVKRMDPTCLSRKLIVHCTHVARDRMAIRALEGIARLSRFYSRFFFSNLPSVPDSWPKPTDFETLEDLLAAYRDILTLDSCFDRYKSIQENCPLATRGTMRRATRYLVVLHEHAICRRRGCHPLMDRGTRTIGGSLDELCKPFTHKPHHITKSLTPEETISVIASTSSIRERLVVLLFLSTGLRLAGLCRLSVPDETVLLNVWDTSTLVTIEKGGQHRTILLSDACKQLLAMWWKTERPPVENRYVFPSRDKLGHVFPKSIGNMCKRVMSRACVPRRKCHSHAFRHTVVLLLYMAGGLSFDTISKWIGHKSTILTSTVYGRLPPRELRAIVEQAPFAGSSTSFNYERSRWIKAAEAIASPVIQSCF